MAAAMNEEVQFENCLGAVVGFTAAQANTFRNRSGIQTIRDLAIIDETTMIESVPANATRLARMALKAAKVWVAEMENLHGEGSDHIVADNFTQAVCNRIR
jgi:predicted RecB family nuclease